MNLDGKNPIHQDPSNPGYEGTKSPRETPRRNGDSKKNDAIPQPPTKVLSPRNIEQLETELRELKRDYNAFIIQCKEIVDKEYLKLEQTKRYQNPKALTTRDSVLASEFWTEDDFKSFLEENHLYKLRSIFWQESGYAKSVESKIFERCDSKKNVMNLSQASVETLFSLLLVQSFEPIHLFWDHSKFVHDFLLVFPLFIKPIDFLEKLKSSFEAKQFLSYGEDSRKYQILKILFKWIFIDRGHSLEDTQLHANLYDFLRNIEAPEFSDSISKIRMAVLTSRAQVPALEKPPAPVESVLDIPALEMARQLTLIEMKIVNKIKIQEFLAVAWCKKDTGASPNIVAVINHGNWVTAWVTTEILKFPTARSRAECYTYFIHVLQHFESFHNFNGMIHILSSLHSSTICKLKKSLPLIQKKDKEALTRISNLMAIENHFSAYKRAQKEVDYNLPCIPLIALICSDLFNMDQNIPTFDGVEINQKIEHWVNWGKMSLIGSSIWELKRFGSVQYNFMTVQVVRDYFLKSEHWDNEETCYEIAVLRDNYEDKEIEQLGLVRTNTDSLWNYNLSERDWKVILTAAQVIAYNAGSVILGPGQRNQYLYRITKGSVRVQLTKTGQALKVLGVNEFFGEISMLLNGRTTAFIIANEDMQVHRIKLSLVVDVCENHPMISASLNLMVGIALAKQLKAVTKKLKSGAVEMPPVMEDAETTESGSETLGKSSFSEKSQRSEPETTEERSDRPISSIEGNSSTVLAAADRAHFPRARDEIPRLMLPAEKPVTIEDQDRRRRRESVGEKGKGALSSPNFRRTKEKDSLKESQMSSRASPDIKGKASKLSKRFQSNQGFSLNSDATFCKRFKLQDEVVVREIMCTVKTTGFASRPATLFLSQRFLCFEANSFGLRIKEAYPLTMITSIRESGGALIVIKGDNSPYTFTNFPPEHASLVQDLWRARKEEASGDKLTQTNSTETIGGGIPDSAKLPTLQPTETDWTIILKGARELKFHKDDTVIKEGSQTRAIYQLVSGKLSIYVTGVTEPIGSIEPKDGIFGEISFLEGGEATATLKASDDCTINIIDSCFLNILFQHHPRLSGRFYHYIASILAQRLQKTFKNPISGIARSSSYMTLSTKKSSSNLTISPSKRLLASSILPEILEAIRGNNVRALNDLLKPHSPGFLSSLSTEELPLMHYACKHTNLETIACLVNQGLHLDTTDKQKNTALHFCALESKTEILMLLLIKGANPALQNQKGFTAKQICSDEVKNAFDLVQKQKNEKISELYPKLKPYLQPLTPSGSESLKVNRNTKTKEGVEIKRKKNSNSVVRVERARREEKLTTAAVDSARRHSCSLDGSEKLEEIIEDETTLMTPSKNKQDRERRGSKVPKVSGSRTRSSVEETESGGDFLSKLGSSSSLGKDKKNSSKERRKTMGNLEKGSVKDAIKEEGKRMDSKEKLVRVSTSSPRETTNTSKEMSPSSPLPQRTNSKGSNKYKKSEGKTSSDPPASASRSPSRGGSSGLIKAITDERKQSNSKLVVEERGSPKAYHVVVTQGPQSPITQVQVTELNRENQRLLESGSISPVEFLSNKKLVMAAFSNKQPSPDIIRHSDN